jgi:hypothetical protein
VTRAKKAAGKPKADRTNKKAEVVALMKRTKGDVGRDSGSHRLAAAHSAGLLVLDSPNRARVNLFFRTQPGMASVSPSHDRHATPPAIPSSRTDAWSGSS